jgi:hypothetical protein
MRVAWTFAFHALFVVAVLLVALLPGVSVTASLVIVSGVVFVFSAVNTLLFRGDPKVRPGKEPPGDPLGARGHRRPSPPGSAGDRFPRRPMPYQPAGSAERELPSH